jgi:hypothetical protein
MIVSYLPEPEQHPLWPAIKVKLLEPAMLDGAEVIDTNELIWIAYEGPTLFRGGNDRARKDGDEVATIIACGGFKHIDGSNKR